MHASLGRGIHQLIESELLVAASKACQQQVKQVSMLAVGNAIDKKLLSTINKILIDKLSIRSFCY
jgi:hypothetical protein